MKTFNENFIKKLIWLVSIIFVIFSIWFLLLVVTGLDPESHSGQLWSATYQIIAWFGAIGGLYFMNLWGGWKSVLGRVNLAFALGLLFLSFGQIVFSYFFFKGIEAPYPSVADIGFFGSIPFYIYGVISLARATGSHLSIRTLSHKLFALVIPATILSLSYIMFLKNYGFDFTQPLVAFLDFGYPLGQAIFISFAIIAYLFSRSFLGGLMKRPIIFFLIALVFQYIADYVFLYQISRDMYMGSLWIDYLYLVAYFIMTLGLLRLGAVFYKIKNS